MTFVDGFCLWIVLQFGKLREQGTGASFHRLARSDQDLVSARRHRGYFSFGRGSFFDRGFCQRPYAFQDLPRIETAFPCKALPVPARKPVAPALTGDLLGEIFGDVVPDLAAHDIVHRSERGPARADHDRAILRMRVGIAGEHIDHDHVEHPDGVGRWQKLARRRKNVLEARTANSRPIAFVLG